MPTAELDIHEDCDRQHCQRLQADVDALTKPTSAIQSQLSRSFYTLDDVRHGGAARSVIAKRIDRSVADKLVRWLNHPDDCMLETLPGESRESLPVGRSDASQSRLLRLQPFAAWRTKYRASGSVMRDVVALEVPDEA